MPYADANLGADEPLPPLPPPVVPGPEVVPHTKCVTFDPAIYPALHINKVMPSKPPPDPHILQAQESFSDDESYDSELAAIYNDDTAPDRWTNSIQNSETPSPPHASEWTQFKEDWIEDSKVSKCAFPAGSICDPTRSLSPTAISEFPGFTQEIGESGTEPTFDDLFEILANDTVQ